MKRNAFKMKLKPGCKNEYRKRHNEIWPELAKMIKDSGVSDYSIFYDAETDYLFAVQKTAGESGSQDLGGEAIVQKWWKYMAEVMDANDDYSPVTVELEEVFYLE